MIVVVKGIHRLGENLFLEVKMFDSPWTIAHQAPQSMGFLM